MTTTRRARTQCSTCDVRPGTTEGVAQLHAGYLKNLFAILDADSVRGREILSRFVAPVVMTPESEGPARRYRATGAFNLAFFLAAASSGARAAGKSSCAGLQPHVGNGLDGADCGAISGLGRLRASIAVYDRAGLGRNGRVFVLHEQSHAFHDGLAPFGPVLDRPGDTKNADGDAADRD